MKENMNRRSFLKSCAAISSAAICPVAIKAADNAIANEFLVKNIDSWASHHAMASVKSPFAQKTFVEENGKKYHAVMPINFVLLPMDDRKMSKYLIEFPVDVRRVEVQDEDDGVWKVMLYARVKGFLKHKALTKYSKLPHVDFSFKPFW